MVLSRVSPRYPRRVLGLLYSQIDAHPGTALVQEEDIRNNLNHDTLASCSSNTIASACRQKTLVRCRQSFPDTCQDQQDAERYTRHSPAKDVADWDNEDIGESQSDYIQAGEKRQLLLSKMELGAEEGKDGSKRQS